MSALIRQSHANNTEALWLSSADGNNTVDGTLTVNGNIVTQGTTNSAGLIMKNAQYMSILDGGVPTQNEVLRITANTQISPYPDGATVTFQTGVNGAFNFGAIGQLPQTSLIVGSGAGADQMLIGGGLSVDGLLQATQVQLVNDDPANGVFGTATLNAGEVVVTTNQADINSLILLTRLGVGTSTTLGELRIRQRNVGSFIITSAQINNPQSTPQTGDTSLVQWIILNPYQS